MTLARATLPTEFMKTRSTEESNTDIEQTAKRLKERFDSQSPEDRKHAAANIANEYYDLVTDFYEFGWGQAFHFGIRYNGETFFESLTRHDHYLALRGGFKEGMKLIDVGCGVGGPLRNMVRLTGAHVTGINNNQYQITRAKRYDAKLGLSDFTDYIKTDFNNIPMADNSIDGAYAIEATCHSTDRKKTYGEILRVLKPGAMFVCYEWIVTDKYDPTNEQHRRIAHGIELGDGLPPMETARHVDAAVKAAGFNLLEAYDIAAKKDAHPAKSAPWYEPLDGNYTSIWGLKSTPMGRWFTSKAMSVMEVLRLCPKGSRAAADVLEEGAINLVAGGKLGIFTPMYFFIAQKPLEGQQQE